LFDIFRLYKRAASAAGILIIVYVIYTIGIDPLVRFFNLGSSLPSLGWRVFEQLPQLIAYALLIVTIIAVAIILLVFFTGYVVFTGWKYREGIAWPFKILIAFILGVVVFFLASPISLAITPIPALIVSAVTIWFCLRTVSKKIGPPVPSVSIDQAVATAKKSLSLDVLGEQIGSEQMSVKQAVQKGKTWIIRLGYQKAGKDIAVEYKIDADTGAIREWRQI